MRCTICGGISVARHTKRAKDDQINRELKRLAKLEQGKEYSWDFLHKGIQKYIWNGHSRIESMESIWKDKIKEHVKIQADEFYERDTVSGSYKFKSFSVPAGKAIHGIITKDNTLRIVTQPAEGKVREIHSRQPHLVDVNGSFDTNIKKTVVKI